MLAALAAKLSTLMASFHQNRYYKFIKSPRQQTLVNAVYNYKRPMLGILNINK